MDKLILADLQALIASPDYGGRGFLQPSSAVLGLSAALFLSDLSIWQGAGYKLTDGEIDEIQAMIAQLEEDLMVTGDMYPMDKCKLTNSLSQSVAPSAYEKILFDTEVYDSDDMHSLVSNTERITITEDGLYLFCARMTFTQDSIGYRLLDFWKHDLALGTQKAIGLTIIQNVNSVARVPLNITIQDVAAEGDYYWIEAHQTSINTLSIVSGDNSPFFEAVRL